MSEDKMEELRRAVAEITGQDPATWPDHGNVPLAIAATVKLLQMKVNDEFHSAVAEARGVLTNLTDREREQFFDALSEGYCMNCYRKVEPNDICYCWNDE